MVRQARRLNNEVDVLESPHRTSARCPCLQIKDLILSSFGIQCYSLPSATKFSLMAPTSAITVLVHEYANGEKGALDRLLPLVYAELRRIAQKHLRDERRGHTLQPTALVHEMYAKLAAESAPEVRDRIHFLSVAAHVMRQILIDHARTKYAQKRGGRQEKFSLDEARDACIEKPAIMVRIDDALNQLARHDPRKVQLIEMRFFGGLTAEESAAVLDLPVNVVRRELRVAQAWLQRELDHGSDEVSSRTAAGAEG